MRTILMIGFLISLACGSVAVVMDRAGSAGPSVLLAAPPDSPRRVGPPRQAVNVLHNEFGTFISRQITVDGDGNNIRRDVANEPSLVIDPTNGRRMAAGFRYFASIDSAFREAGYAYSSNGGQTWTFAGVLDPGPVRTDPVLDADSQGRFYYYCGRGLNNLQLFASDDGGRTWGIPLYTRGGHKQWLAVDRSTSRGRDNLYCVWNGGWFARSRTGGRSFDAPVRLSEPPHSGTMAVGTKGEVYLAGFYHRFLRSRNARGDGAPSFELVTKVDMGGRSRTNGPPNPTGGLGQATLGVDYSGGPRRGWVYLLCSVQPSNSNDPMDVMFARSRNRGKTWSRALRVNDDPTNNKAWQWFGTIAVSRNGRIDAVWNDTRNTGKDELSQLYYAYSSDGGRHWTQNIPVSNVFDSTLGQPNHPVQKKIGDYYGIRSNAVGAHVVYSATFNGEQDVYYLQIKIDCNQNGMHDGDDIALGLSLDRNHNGIPDECEG